MLTNYYCDLQIQVRGHSPCEFMHGLKSTDAGYSLRSDYSFRWVGFPDEETRIYCTNRYSVYPKLSEKQVAQTGVSEMTQRKRFRVIAATHNTPSRYWLKRSNRGPRSGRPSCHRRRLSTGTGIAGDAVNRAGPGRLHRASTGHRARVDQSCKQFILAAAAAAAGE